MGEILTTVIRRHRVAAGAGNASQGRSGPWRALTNVAFHETPCRLDRIEVVRVRGQSFEHGAALLNEEVDFRSLVCREVVEHDDIAASQPRRQSATNPLDEADLIHGVPLRAEHDPTSSSDR